MFSACGVGGKSKLPVSVETGSNIISYAVAE